MTTIGPGMRVKCVLAEWILLHGGGERASGPALGSISIVTNVFQDLGLEFLVLKGWDGDAFRSICFIPIDDLGDLRELARKAKNPDALTRKRELV